MSNIDLSVAGAVATLTFDRPSAANAIDIHAAREFTMAVEAVAASAARALVVTGRGSVFCAGGDVVAITQADDARRYIEELAEEFHRGIAMLDEISAVVVAAVNGPVAGAGLGVVLASDIAIAARSATFRTAYDMIGLTPDSGVTLRLPRAIGERRALAMSVTGRVLDADTAERWGLVDDTVDDEGLDAAVEQIVESLTAGSIEHVTATRRLYRASWGAAILDRLDEESALIGWAVSTPRAHAALRRFRAR